MWDLADKEAKAVKASNQKESNPLSLQEMGKPTILEQITQAVATWLEADAKKIERLVKVKKVRKAIKTTLGLTIWSCLLHWLSTAVSSYKDFDFELTDLNSTLMHGLQQRLDAEAKA